MTYHSGDLGPGYGEKYVLGSGLSPQTLNACKLLWFAASWLPGLLLFPFNWLAELPLYIYISRHEPEYGQRLPLFSSAVVIPLLSAIAALLLYASGHASILSAAPPASVGQVDAYTRLPYGGPGLGHGYLSLLRRLPNNAVLYALRACAGPPPGTYDGPFPSLGEAMSVLNSGAIPISYASFSSGSFNLGSEGFSFPPDRARGILSFSGMPDAQIDSLRGGVFAERCLVLGIVDSGRLASIVLVDLDSGEAFSSYRVPQRLHRGKTPSPEEESSGALDD